ncbi:MAG: LamG-like jellyroll fold domain-containing protein [Candidatus Paceibacterota bacterium]|jgi:prepilin-type N-terminal cleavage/methylation domain-containing protein
MNRNLPKPKNSAFTLIELLVVIAIIGILAGMVVVNITGATDTARIAKGKAFSASIRNSLLLSRVSSWSMDEGNGSGVADAWPGGNAAAIYGPVWSSTTSCVSGSCLFFDGYNDYVQINDSSSLDEVFGTENFTLEAWVYPQDWINYRGIINKRQNGYYSASPGGLFADASGIKFIIGTGNPAESANALVYQPSLDQWHHIAAVANKTTMYLYVDGQRRASTAITLDPPSNDEPLCIGSFYQTTRSFRGYIDEVKIYNQPMQVSQVSENYFAGLGKLFKKGMISEGEYSKRARDFAARGKTEGGAE